MQLVSKILRVMAAESISAEELHHMVKHAAISTRDGFNRRYFHWLFKVQGNVLQDMRLEAMIEVGEGLDSVYEEHESCSGDGCRECGWAGEVIRHVTDKIAPTFSRARV